MKKIDLTIADLPFSAEEALNRLRVNVRFSGATKKKIMVTSSLPNEGKSHVSVYLWKMLADAGYSTVLVDADLRKTVMKDELQLKIEGKEPKGLDHYLAGMAEFEDVIYETNIDHGFFVPCINLLENPSSLLEDPRLGQLLENLANTCDYVIIDSPPLISVSDGALIGALCDGTILVVRSDVVPKNMVIQSVRQLERAGAKLLGTVLNGVSATHHAYGKYYGKYYGRYGDYYGDYYGEGKKGRSRRRKKEETEEKDTEKEKG